MIRRRVRLALPQGCASASGDAAEVWIQMIADEPASPGSPPHLCVWRSSRFGPGPPLEVTVEQSMDGTSWASVAPGSIRSVGTDLL